MLIHDHRSARRRHREGPGRILRVLPGSPGVLHPRGDVRRGPRESEGSVQADPAIRAGASPEDALRGLTRFVSGRTCTIPTSARVGRPGATRGRGSARARLPSSGLPGAWGPRRGAAGGGGGGRRRLRKVALVGPLWDVARAPRGRRAGGTEQGPSGSVFSDAI